MKDFNIYLSTLKRKSEREVKCLALNLQLVAVLKKNKTKHKTYTLGGVWGGSKTKRALSEVTPGTREETIIKQTKIESQFHFTMFFFYFSKDGLEFFKATKFKKKKR